MRETKVDQMNGVQLYGAVPVQQRAETVHSLQITTAPTPVFQVVDTLSALATWKVAA
jgi:hypothetical protein